MAFDEFLGDRIRRILEEKHVVFTERKMMGGLIFMIDEKIMCGIHIDKKIGDSLLMARIGEAAYEQHIDREECRPMDFTGRPMRGYIFIVPDGMDTDEDLAYWVQLAVDFNPLAKASKKRKKKS